MTSLHDRPVRLGLAGTGYWAQDTHLPVLASTPGAVLVGLWGRDPERADAVAHAAGLIAFRGFDDLLDAVDAVSFAVPPEVQATLALRAARAGKHLLLEKPLAIKLDAAEAIAREVASRHLATVVFFTRRFAPEIAEALAAVANLRFSSAQIRVEAAALATGSPYASSAWRRADGAALWDIGPHVLSVLRPLLGAVEEVAVLHRRDGAVGMTTAHSSGAVADAVLALNREPSAVFVEYRLVGPAGQLRLPEPTFTSLTFRRALARAATAFVAAIRSDAREHDCDIRLGLEITRVLAAGERSAALGRAVRIDSRTVTDAVGEASSL